MTRTCLLSLICLILVFPALHAQAQEGRPRDSNNCDVGSAVFEISGGSTEGGLNSFIRDLGRALQDDDADELFLKPCDSDGSAANLEALQNHSVEFALAPNDLVYDQYNSVRFSKLFWDFRPVLPLFRNYQQVIVHKEGGIEDFEGLRGKRVATGTKGSAADINAVDIIVEAGLGERMPDGQVDTDLERDHRGIGGALNHLDTCNPLAGENGCEIDAVIMTGSWRDLENEYPNLMRIQVPVGILEGLAEDKPYYFIVSPPTESSEKDLFGELQAAQDEGRGGSVQQGSGLSESTLNELRESGYYLVRLGDEGPRVLSTTTYLMTHTGVDEDRIRVLIEAIHKSWSAIGEVRIRNEEVGINDLVDLNLALISRPIPFHPAADAYLRQEGLIFPSMRWYWALAIFCLILICCSFFWRLHARDYDRLGVATAGAFRDRLASVRHWFADSVLDRLVQLFKGGNWKIFLLRLLWSIIYIVAVVIFCFMVALLVLLATEGDFASTNAQPNQFFTQNIWDNLIWIFTWMATGFENGLYPISPFGRTLAAAIGVTGVAVPLWLIYRLFTDAQARQESRERGESVEKLRNLHDHVLVCGWNSKVPGLIYSLTGRDAPEKQRIVVVAEMDEDFPLKPYRFNPLYVHYCRGDSSDSRILDRANMEKARHAIIVAGEKKVEAKNSGSALTALALKSKEKEEKIHLVAELVSESNIESVRQLDAHASIINAQSLAESLMAIALDNPDIIDFVLDMITYDRFDECSSLTVSELRKKIGLKDDAKTTLGKLFFSLRERGANLLAYRKADLAGADNKDSPDQRLGWHVLLTEGENTIELERDDQVALTCNDIRHLDRKLGIEIPALEYADEALFSGEGMPGKIEKVLLVGDANRARRIGHYLGIELEDRDIVAPEETGGAEMNDKPTLSLIKRRLEGGNYGGAIILNSASGLGSVDHDESQLGDAEVILRSQVARNCTQSGDTSSPFKIVAEICHLRNQALLKKVDVSTVVTLDILVQRFLAKPVFDQGRTIGLMRRLMNLQDQVHFRTFRLEGKHPLIGKKLNDVLDTFYRDGRVIGCDPGSAKHKKLAEDLENKDGDFHTHFITTPSKKTAQVELEAGDIIIGIFREPGLTN